MRRRDGWTGKLVKRAGGAVLALVLAVAPAAADDPVFRETVQVRASTKAALAPVKVVTLDTKSGKQLPKAAELSDLWLRLWSDNGDVNTFIAQPNVAKPDPDKAIMTIELFSVVDGKLHSDTTGTCSAWANNIAWCKYGCDGQGFELKRVKSEYPIDLRILVSAKARATKNSGGAAGRGPLSLSLCGADERGNELLIVPASGAGDAEIKLDNK